ncbi:MAG: GIY-YIG nuclease family protein [Clostridia bacterium]|nr:GIY-YIG nuclease family protein [Clostridia bacterium]
MDCFVYILRCAGDNYYCGWTNDVPARLTAHKNGKGAKFTRSHKVEDIVYLEACEDKSAALRREIEIKRLTHAQKIELCRLHANRTAALLVEQNVLG